MAAKKGNTDGGKPKRWRPEYVKQAEALCLLGYTDEKLAEFFRVGTATVARWKVRYPAFKAAVADAKEVKDAQVMSALYQRAVGYSHPDSHITNVGGEVVVTPTVKHYPPDTPAALFWLCNRQPQMFKKDPKPIEEDGENAQPLTINFGVNDPVKEVRITRGKAKS